MAGVKPAPHDIPVRRIWKSVPQDARVSKAKAKPNQPPPIIVIAGDDAYQKLAHLERTLDELLPPEVDRALALSVLDGARKGEQPPPTASAVLQELATLPFLADRRVVVIRSADNFITDNRERLESYAESPCRTGVLVLECRAFQKQWRLYKAVEAIGGRILECKKLTGRALVEFVVARAGERQKRIEPAAAAKLVDLIGAEPGMLEGEVEKLALYAGSRSEITLDDVAALVGQTREEKVFAAMDAAATGDLHKALSLWHQVLETDPASVYKAVGGVAFMLRKWLTAHNLAAQGEPLGAIAPRVMMWGRERDLAALLKRLPARAIRRYLAALADLDSQAKQGLRSIENGVELLLARLATPAA